MGKLSIIAGALLLAASLSGAAPVAAQSALHDAQPITIGETLTLHSDLLKEDRHLLIHLPQGYETSTQRYPVMYLLDGEAHFEHVAGIVDYLTEQGKMPPVILVGIANTNRTRDLTPPAKTTKVTIDLPALATSYVDDSTGGGGADTFLAFIRTELIPAIEAKYRTAHFRILAGHSFGGLFAVHTLTTDPDLFDAYLVASPSLWWDNEALVRAAGKAMPAFGTRHHWLFASVGGDESAIMLGAFGDFHSELTLANMPRLDWTTRTLDGDTHGMTPHETFYQGLQWVFRDYALDDAFDLSGDVDRIEKHYADASRIYGIDLSVSEAEINNAGYSQLQFLHRPDRAVPIFRRNVALHPQSPNVYDSLADGLEAEGKDAEALQNRETAVRLGTEQKAPNLDAFRQGRDRLKAKLGLKQALPLR
jgi:predicted alpha/beta superfamily hydrolase